VQPSEIAPSFTLLVDSLKQFKLSKKAVSEHELEIWALEYLAKKGYKVTTQKRTRSGRYDITVEIEGFRYCIELKMIADRSCLDQLDRYARSVNGLILLCWQASTAVISIIKFQKSYSKIPIELIEVKRNCDIV